ncbi:MAG: sodium-dependent transporter [Bryobacteraceae bacterium]|nr:sodium-dependent transporter [Bryobacteraceae bacterium]
MLSTAGVAIGLGNIWRFPYMMGAFGGIWFLGTYVACVLGVGIPALMCEWALGRATGRGPWGAFESASMPGGRYWGYALGLSIFMAASYYVVVIGWVARYLVLFAAGGNVESPHAEFAGFAGRPWTQFIYIWPCILLCGAALGFGVRRGIERISKWGTPVFLLVFVALAARSLTLEGAWRQTVAYLAAPGEFSPRTVLAALGQCIFSLALGGTSMVVYGSYLQRRHPIAPGAVATAGLDLAASLIAALIVIPPALVFGIRLESGPPLLFEAAPALFQAMPAGGNLLAVLFLLAAWICAMLSLMGAYEVIVAGIQDRLNWPRSRALALLVGLQSVLIVPALHSLDYIFYSDLFWGSTMQPVGAAAAVCAVAWGFGRVRTIEEWTRGGGVPFAPWLFFWVKYVVPAAILAGLIYGWFG